jgi:acyl-CoA thioester hydrolase
MPAVHTETFKARFYECNPFGFLKYMNYLRWMGEAAFSASAAVGYDFSSYDRLGQLWLVRETKIDYLSQISYGNEVAIKTWVMDIRRFRSNRAYEFTKIKSGQIAARARTDWVYLHSFSLKPAPIPNEMKLAFFPEGIPANFPRPSRFPKPAASLKNPIIYRKVVGWDDIDRMRHVNNATYLNFIEEADVFTCEACGCSLERMFQERRRLDTRSQHLEYHQPARYGDTVEITMWHSDIKPGTAVRHYEIRRVEGGDLLVRARSVLGFSNMDTGVPCNLPKDFREFIANHGGKH